MKPSKYVTVMFIPDGTESRQGFRIRQWLLKFIVGAVIFLVVGILLFFAFYGKILTRAALSDKLEAENQRLLRYQYKVKMLENSLIETRDQVGRLMEMAGIDYEFPEFPSDSTIFATLDRSAVIRAERSSLGDMTQPAGLPLQGFISQDFEIEDPQRFHPGIDIATAEGRPVLATAAGLVISAEVDSVYGFVVVLRHNDSTTTTYAHNKEILVKVGQKIPAGGRLALSGNSGISSAPHVHYEVRIHDKPINPLESSYDKKNNQ